MDRIFDEYSRWRSTSPGGVGGSLLVSVGGGFVWGSSVVRGSQLVRAGVVPPRLSVSPYRPLLRSTGLKRRAVQSVQGRPRVRPRRLPAVGRFVCSLGPVVARLGLAKHSPVLPQHAHALVRGGSVVVRSGSDFRPSFPLRRREARGMMASRGT